MMKDKALEELFLAQKHQFNDKDAFMSQLMRKLDAVEYLRLYEEANLRRYKLAMIAAFVMGLFSGAGLLAFMLWKPVNEPLFTFDVTSGFLLDILQNSRMIVSFCLMLLMSYCILCIVSNIQELTKMKTTFPSNTHPQPM